MTCPRCGGRLLPDVDGDRTCLNCGHVVVHDLETARALAEYEQPMRGRDRGSRRRPTHGKLKL